MQLPSLLLCLAETYHIAKAATQSNRASPFQWSPDTVHFDEPPAQPERPKATHAGAMARQDPRLFNRGNPNQNEKIQRRSEPTQHELPDRTTSKNPWINGAKVWTFSKDGHLCVRCGVTGHGARLCETAPLPSWERAYLRMIVFGDDPQVNFTSVGCGQFDGNLHPYTPPPMIQGSSSTASSHTFRTPSNASIDSFVVPRANSIRVSTAGLESPYQLGANSTEANYGETSGPNKRPHIEDPEPASQQEPFKFQSGEDDRPKKKGQNKVGKKTEPQPLIGMFNDTIGKYDSPISIRQVLQNKKVDITWMDLAAWSPQVCKELKRLCTRVSKKKPKDKDKDKGKEKDAEPLNPFGQFNPQYPQRGPQQSQQQMPQQVPQQVPQQMPHQYQTQQQQQMPQQQMPQQQMPQQQMPQQQMPQQQMPQQQMPQQQMPQQQMPQQQMPQQQMPQQQGSQQAPHPNVQTQMPPNVTGRVTANLVSNTTAAEAEKHTRDLNDMKNVDKAFRIPAVVTRTDGTTVPLQKSYVQADQGSDINVISQGLVRLLKLDLRPLLEIGFKGLSMRTADHRDTVLHYYVWLRLTVEGVQRDLRCFVAPEVITYTPKGEMEYLSLILGIPWLSMVDAQISIRGSMILVGDISAGETPRLVQGPEMVFCKWHNLLMYPKDAIAPPDRTDGVDTSDDDDEDELSDAEEPRQGF